MTTPKQYLENNQNPNGILYYPGSGSDFGPFKLFTEAGQYSTVIYADYLTKHDDALSLLNSIPGWQLAGPVKDIQPSDLNITSWDECWPRSPRARNFANPETAYGIEAQMQSETGLKARFIFLATEAIQTYSVLVNAGFTPTALVLQDHGFGGNWTRFCGEGSPLYRNVQKSHTNPLLLSRDPPYPGYEKITDHIAYEGSMHGHSRALFCR
jgi:hypothetical protein